MVEATPAYRILTSREVLSGPEGLDGINTHPLNQGAVVLAAGAIYRLDRNSADVPDGLTVVQPAAGPGRWLFVAAPGGSYVSVADLAALAALGASSPNLVWVATLECYWHRRPASTLVPDGITVVAAIGGGNWERVVPTTSPRWCAQASWTVDPATGDDENVGSALLPVATFAEINRRLSVGPLQQDTTVAVVAGAVVPEANLSVDNDGYLLTVAGVPAAARVGSVGTYTERVHSPVPTPSLLTDPGVADWTAEYRSRLRITSGAAEGAIAWVAAASPGGAGLNVAATSRFGLPPTAALYLPTIVIPAAASAYVVETLPRIGHLSLHQRPGRSIRSVNQQMAFLVKDLVLGGVTQARICLDTDPLFQVVVDGCIIDAFVRSSVVAPVLWTRCQWGGTSAVGAGAHGQHKWRCCCFTKPYFVFDDRCFSFWQSLSYGVTASGGAFTQSSVSFGIRVHMKFDDSQIFDVTNGPAINFVCAGDVWTHSGLSGSRNKYGLMMGDGSDEALGDQYFFWSYTGDLPNLLGVTSDIVIRGTTDILVSWAAGVPFRSDEQRGTADLDAGTVVVAARNALLRGVEISMNTPGGTPGFLSAPTASRSNTQFVINSTSVLDESTVDWRVLPMARQVVICQGSAIT